jgi:7,8-dihydroneopterin aldolase/epimerase/oxygenase
MADQVFLRGIELFGRHGVTEEERSESQLIELDVEATLDLAPAGQSDDLADTVDYGAMFETCRDVVEKRSLHLLEAIADQVATALLSRFGRLGSVRVTVRKPGVPIDGRVEQAGVTIERSRT